MGTSEEARAPKGSRDFGEVTGAGKAINEDRRRWLLWVVVCSRSPSCGEKINLNRGRGGESARTTFEMGANSPLTARSSLELCARRVVIEAASPTTLDIV